MSHIQYGNYRTMYMYIFTRKRTRLGRDYNSNLNYFVASRTRKANSGSHMPIFFLLTCIRLKKQSANKKGTPQEKFLSSLI